MKILNTCNIINKNIIIKYINNEKNDVENNIKQIYYLIDLD